MDQCEFFETCIFVETDKGASFKESYCNSNSLRCARYMITQALGADKVPEDLLPDEKAKAYAILAEG